jgi:pilus assembly protein CpaF
VGEQLEPLLRARFRVDAGLVDPVLVDPVLVDPVLVDPVLLDRVRRRLAASGVRPTPAAVATAVRAEHGAPVGDRALLSLSARLRSELVGAGPLEPLLADPEVTDILVNGADDVWVDRGRGLEPVELSFPDDAAVRRLAQRLAAACGRRLDDGRPWVDARLPDGTRLHAVLPPVAGRGVCLSLRAFRSVAFTLGDLVDRGTVPAPVAELLAAIVAARLAFLVTGGTGSGKTTLLGTLLGLVPPRERIVLVEDAAELRPDHPHVVPLEARPPNAEGAGEITLRDLVRQALRMRPDRLVVGECRGPEVVDLLAALNTGHEGGAGTLHANAARDVPARLEALAALGAVAPDALHAQLGPALNCVVHLVRAETGRRVDEVCVLARGRSGRVEPRPAWSRRGGAGPAAGALATLLRDRGVTPPAVLTRGAGRAGDAPTTEPAPRLGAVIPLPPARAQRSASPPESGS